MTSQNLLPEEFKTLEPLVAVWALPTQNERQQRRIASTRPALKSFYDTMLQQLPAILKKLDEFPLDQLPQKESRLMTLALSLAEVAPHIELYGGDPKVPYAFDEARFVAEHGQHAN
ncbi:hypothetical protein G7047_13335 [Diaphorobacter sp. HDW4A]|uniref:hypothetical protein n=1 Tax=Diaphorobacter sp. HDW4A TaxID=2714924 RepID=UPI00140C85C6|nr:hypothetical protein [Diaphorobacter sp. HDW4A]QIL80778.1 hypothetical protein G7047_13335 [Diaphorobacter sp. HDW4A]